MMPRTLKKLAAWFSFAQSGGRPTNRNPVRILAVMPNNSDGVALSQIAKRAQWHFELTESCESAIDKLSDQNFAIVLCDRDVPGSNWRDAVQTLAAKAPRTCVILTSPVNDDYLWQEVIERGGYDVLTKPFQEERVVRAVRFAWSCWKSDLTRAQAQRTQA
ncbi:MAG: response regulator [Bryobacteraceae bacterium]